MKSRPGDELETLKGVGAVRLEQLHRLKLFTLEDLLLCQPRRYEDRTHLPDLAVASVGESLLARGVVCAHGVNRFRRGRKSVYEFVLDTGSGRLHCRFWNMPYLESQFSVGMDVFVHGRITGNRPVTMDHPEYEIVEEEEGKQIHLNRIVPVYRLTEGLPQRWLRQLVWRALDETDFEESPDEELVTCELGLGRRDGFRQLHFPGDMEAPVAARRRFALEEFIQLQREFARRRERLRRNCRTSDCSGDNNRFIRPFLKRLGFKLTDAQARVLREIRLDLGHRYPMRRLLHGDVGSGKTAVAVCAALMAMESGFDVALMAPTEILVRQHFRRLADWLHGIGVTVELLTGNEHQRTGTEPPVLTVGTHALIHQGYQPARLGLVIIDEQHRFGVVQREKLVRKGTYPHLLVMTATPIPRTLGLTAYGDLDVSVLDQMPAQRGRIHTYLRSPDAMEKVWGFVADALQAGRQAYVVYPRIEEDNSEKGLKSVTEEFDRLRERFAPHGVGLLHGRMSPEQSHSIASAFQRGELPLLVATTVIEVGVDVPNATIMVIENAGQFGLSQLHQLRGRIGRGSEDSYCILVEDSRKQEAVSRLKVMLETNDGFRIAEEDMRLRGVGDFLGARQSGLPRFRFGDLNTDFDLVVLARELVESNPAEIAC